MSLRMQGAGKGQVGTLCFMQSEDWDIWEDEKVLEMDGDDECRTMGMYSTPQISTLENGESGTFSVTHT